MNELMTLYDIQMTSVELAKLIGKQHKHILTDIRNELERLKEEGQPIFRPSSYINRQNKQQPCYTFGKKGAMQLALKYDAVTRYKVIEYLERLEADFNSPEKTIARAFLMLNQQLEEIKPYADFGKAISAAEDGILFGEYAKLLMNDGIAIGQNRLFQWMRNNGYILKTGKRKNEPLQKYIEMGVLALKETKVKINDREVVRCTPLVTGKGQKYFYEKLKSEVA